MAWSQKPDRDSKRTRAGQRRRHKYSELGSGDLCFLMEDNDYKATLSVRAFILYSMGWGGRK